MLAKSLTLIIIICCTANLNGGLFFRRANYRQTYRQVCIPQDCTTVIKPQNIQPKDIQNTPSVMKKPSTLPVPIVSPNLGRDYNETKDLQNQSNVVEPTKPKTEETELFQFDNDQFTPLRNKTDVYYGYGQQTLLTKPSTVFEMVPFIKVAK